MKQIFAAAITAAAILFAASCRSDKIVPSSLECSGVVRYSTGIRPFVLTHCAITGCHVTGFPQGDYTLYQPLKVRADNGRLRFFVLELRNMPPNDSVTEEQRQMIGCWIEQGALNN